MPMAIRLNGLMQPLALAVKWLLNALAAEKNRMNTGHLSRAMEVFIIIPLLADRVAEGVAYKLKRAALRLLSV